MPTCIVRRSACAPAGGRDQTLQPGQSCGRKNKDLYDRLKEDIDKSRATFKKRYGNTVAANVYYLQAEIVRSLAEDDILVMGPNFRR